MQHCSEKRPRETAGVSTPRNGAKRVSVGLTLDEAEESHIRTWSLKLPPVGPETKAVTLQTNPRCARHHLIGLRVAAEGRTGVRVQVEQLFLSLFVHLHSLTVVRHCNELAPSSPPLRPNGHTFRAGIPPSKCSHRGVRKEWRKRQKEGECSQTERRW